MRSAAGRRRSAATPPAWMRRFQRRTLSADTPRHPGDLGLGTALLEQFGRTHPPRLGQLRPGNGGTASSWLSDSALGGMPRY
ncbi:hypothetical protein Acsp04_43390 [Actinomadura sp. NBRC 104425]|nr:hypothetical protein Acsp04_43390 [Actinomadura sp. NBRC 104425]